MKPAPKLRLIRASEIGEYLYCHRAWWLRHIRGEHSRNVRELDSGTAAHAGHGQQVALASGLQVAAYALVALALLIGVLWLIGLIGH